MSILFYLFLGIICLSTTLACTAGIIYVGNEAINNFRKKKFGDCCLDQFVMVLTLCLLLPALFGLIFSVGRLCGFELSLEGLPI